MISSLHSVLEQPALHAPFLSYSDHAAALRVQFPAFVGGVEHPSQGRATTITTSLAHTFYDLFSEIERCGLFYTLFYPFALILRVCCCLSLMTGGLCGAFKHTHPVNTPPLFHKLSTPSLNRDCECKITYSLMCELILALSIACGIGRFSATLSTQLIRHFARDSVT